MCDQQAFRSVHLISDLRKFRERKLTLFSKLPLIDKTGLNTYTGETNVILTRTRSQTKINLSIFNNNIMIITRNMKRSRDSITEQAEPHQVSGIVH